MSVGSLDPAAWLDFAIKHLNIENILIQVGLDPNNITYEAIFNRLLDLALLNITFANFLALIGAIFLVSTFVVRTIVPMRVLSIVSIFFFLGAAALSGSVPKFLMYFLALPANVVRLVQIRNLVKRARSSAQGTLSLDWLRPYMTPRRYQKGEVLFRKGDAADEMLLTVSGKFLVSEIGIEIPPERILGELGFLSPNNHRTQSVECIEDGEVLTITYEKLLAIYMQNPEFGYYFLRLTSDRLLQNHARLEAAVEQAKAALAAARAPKAVPKAELSRAGMLRFARAAMLATSRLGTTDADTAVLSAAAGDSAAVRRRVRALMIVERHANYAAAGGFLPVPFVNEAAIMAINMRMVRALHDVYGREFDYDRAHGLVVGVLGGVIPARLAALTSILPGLNLVGYAVASMSASAYSRKVGRLLLDHFEREAAIERARTALEEIQRSNIWFRRLARTALSRSRLGLEQGLRLARLKRSREYERAS